MLKKDDGKRKNHIQAMADGYDAIAKEQGDELPQVPTMVETLKKQHENGIELNSMKKLILGQAQADEKRRAKLDTKKQREAEAMHHNTQNEG